MIPLSQRCLRSLLNQKGGRSVVGRKPNGFACLFRVAIGLHLHNLPILNRSHLLAIKRFESIALPKEIRALCSTIPERCREPVIRVIQQASRLFLELRHNRNQGRGCIVPYFVMTAALVSPGKLRGCSDRADLRRRWVRVFLSIDLRAGLVCEWMPFSLSVLLPASTVEW